MEEETTHFLSCKSEWKEEIDRKLEELKKVETALSSKEQELKKVCRCALLRIGVCFLRIGVGLARVGIIKEILI